MELDLHIHTKYSPCSGSAEVEPKEVVRIAKERGLSGIAITDHNSSLGGLNSLQYSSKDFLVISGIEINITYGHLLGLFIEQEIVYPREQVLNPLEALRLIRNLNGIAILAHPCFSFVNLGEMDEGFLGDLDGMEEMNGNHGGSDILELYKKFHFAKTGGSDAHTYGEIGRAVTVFETDFTEEEIRVAIWTREAESKLYSNISKRI